MEILKSPFSKGPACRQAGSEGDFASNPLLAKLTLCRYNPPHPSLSPMGRG